MEDINVKVRAARPEDATRVAELIMMAWPMESFLAEHPDLAYGDFHRGVAAMVAADDTLYSWRNTLVATVVPAGGTPASEEGAGSAGDASCEEVIAGTMVGYDGARFAALRRSVQEAFSAITGEIVGEWPDETGPGEYYLDSAGVDPAFRGHGIGSTLFEAMFRRARSEGHVLAGLIVDEDNPAAERLYQRIGFRHVGWKDFFGHRMKHMQREL